MVKIFLTALIVSFSFFSTGCKDTEFPDYPVTQKFLYWKDKNTGTYLCQKYKLVDPVQVKWQIDGKTQTFDACMEAQQWSTVGYTKEQDAVYRDSYLKARKAWEESKKIAEEQGSSETLSLQSIFLHQFWKAFEGSPK